MVVNNWFVVVQMFTNILETNDDDIFGWNYKMSFVRVYFVSFWIIMVLL